MPLSLRVLAVVPDLRVAVDLKRTKNQRRRRAVSGRRTAETPPGPSVALRSDLGAA